jgi:hypothetical protein
MSSGLTVARPGDGSYGLCEDIASVACFLLSDAAGMLNGFAFGSTGVSQRLSLSKCRTYMKAYEYSRTIQFEG